ncbi:GNAT family N-acetyltransferase [Granulicella arctica]|uniref:GNAT family N-acetyltransferase n=1 Tax=Granulicella arctica TaxID=940613 RepID=UPI0021E0AE89|nr:GNAT family N-acetyltransferase [Granulicella arctica]
MNLHLQPARPEDALFLEVLFRDVHEPEFAPLQLPPQALAQLIAMQFRAQSLGYASQYPDAQDHIVIVGDEAAGRLLIHRDSQQIQLIDIALLARFRNQGLGSELLRLLIQEAAQVASVLRLTVRFDNAALRLYQKKGFIRTGGDGLNLAMEWRAEAPCINPSFPIAQPMEPAEQGFTGTYFLSLAGQTFTANDQMGTSIPLLLETVNIFHGQVSTEDSFSLQFTGPLMPVLRSECVELTPPAADPMELFLVANGPAQGRMRYEAIFNRAVPW